MAADNLIFKDSEEARDAIIDSQKKEIAMLYNKWASEIAEKAKHYSHLTTPSSEVAERQMKELEKQLRATSKVVANEIYNKTKQNLYTIADSVVKDNAEWLKSLGFSSEGINAAFSSVPDSVVRNLITGQIYEGGWNLSSRIWSDNENIMKDAYRIVAKGLAENSSIYDVAKQLESYVRPNAKKPWNLRLPDGVKLYKKTIDYNAQRLARTLVQHGYQQSFIAVTKNNPFVTEYRWSSNGSRACELCQERDGKVFKKDELPMDHPNGMCTMVPVIADNLEDKIADWVNSKDGTFPDIDKFAKELGYKTETQQFNTRNIVNGENISETWKRRKNLFDFEISDVIDAQGFNGLPNIVNADEFDKYVKESGLIAQRAYSAPTKEILDEYRKQLYYGEWYVDCSVGGAAFGNGMYAIPSYDGSISDFMTHGMELYKNRFGDRYSYVETMTLTRDAKIIKTTELRKIKEQYEIKAMEELRASGWSADVANKWDSIIHTDDGTFAAKLGYDALSVDIKPDTEYPEIIVLNRTKVIFRNGG